MRTDSCKPTAKSLRAFLIDRERGESQKPAGLVCFSPIFQKQRFSGFSRVYRVCIPVRRVLRLCVLCFGEKERTPEPSAERGLPAALFFVSHEPRPVGAVLFFAASAIQRFAEALLFPADERTQLNRIDFAPSEKCFARVCDWSAKLQAFHRAPRVADALWEYDNTSEAPTFASWQ
jgi:hypothetical protein